VPLGAQASLGWRKPVVLRGLAVAAPAAEGGRPLLQAARLTTSATLWDVAAGRRFDAVLAAPRVCGARTATGDWRLDALLQARRACTALSQHVHRMPALCQFSGVRRTYPTVWCGAGCCWCCTHHDLPNTERLPSKQTLARTEGLACAQACSGVVRVGYDACQWACDCDELGWSVRRPGRAPSSA